MATPAYRRDRPQGGHVLTTRQGIRPLGPADLTASSRSTGRDPVSTSSPSTARDHQPRAALARRRGVGPLSGGELVAGCHVGANLVPVECDAATTRARSASARWPGPRPSTIVGPHERGRGLLEHGRRPWGTPRERAGASRTWRSRTTRRSRPTREVRRTTRADLDALYPACVAMYTEEVGVSPESGGGARLYRARVRQLISRGWSFARFEARPGRLQGRGRLRLAVRRADPGRLRATRPPRRGPGRPRDGGRGRSWSGARSRRRSRSTSTSGTSPPAAPTSGSASGDRAVLDRDVLSHRPSERPAS